MLFYKNIRLLLGWIREIFRVGFRNRQIVKNYSLYLKEGKYKNSLRGDYIYEKSSRSYLREKTYFSLTHFNKVVYFILNWLADLFTYVVKSDDNKVFHGTEIILSTNQTETKFFSIEGREVLTKYKNLEKLKKLTTDKEYFGKFFNVPQTKKIDLKNGFIVEEFIPHVSFDVNHAFQYFCSELINYIKDIKETVSYDEEGDKKKVSKFIDYLGYSDLLLKVGGMPKIVVHGDFWSFNIIFDGRKYYLIDYEKKGTRFFLFDFFSFIFSECTLLKDDRLLDSYINGSYDEILTKMFGAIGYKYDKTMRGLYFVIFLVEILNEKIWSKELTNEMIGGLLRKYVPNYYNEK